MRLAICVTVKNRSCVIVDEEDSLSFLHHVKDKLQDTPQCEIKPYFTKQNQIALLLLPKMLRSLMKQKKQDDDWVVIVVDYKSTDIDMKAMLEYELG